MDHCPEPERPLSLLRDPLEKVGKAGGWGRREETRRKRGVLRMNKGTIKTEKDLP